MQHVSVLTEKSPIITLFASIIPCSICGGAATDSWALTPALTALRMDAEGVEVIGEVGDADDRR